jgi:hypothetical protein
MRTLRGLGFRVFGFWFLVFGFWRGLVSPLPTYTKRTNLPPKAVAGEING